MTRQAFRRQVGGEGASEWAAAASEAALWPLRPGAAELALTGPALLSRACIASAAFAKSCRGPPPTPQEKGRDSDHTCQTAAGFVGTVAWMPDMSGSRQNSPSSGYERATQDEHFLTGIFVQWCCVARRLLELVFYRYLSSTSVAGNDIND